MRSNYAGVALELGHVVYIVDLWAASPIFHARRHYRDDIDPGVTVCGLELHQRAKGHVDATALPPRHALRIGRPCFRCYPDLRNRTLALEAP